MSAEVPDPVSALLAGLAPGTQVAGYRLEEPLGAGGMAVVFLATDQRLGRRVALKVLAPALASDQAFRRRFLRESRAAAAVDDPHIIPVYEAGESGGVLFIAMRYVPGRDVRTLLNEHGPLTTARAAAILSPVASALDAAHAAGLVHRDVKPANMLIDVRPNRPDHVYLSDFGLTKGAASSAALTGSGQFLGTPNYTSPEQIRGESVDGHADQYALACATFEMLTGEPPFERDQGIAVLLAHLYDPVPPASARRPDLPPAIDQVFAMAMAKEPTDRYPTCHDFAETLRRTIGMASYHPSQEPSASAGYPVAEIGWPARAASKPAEVGGPGSATGAEVQRGGTGETPYGTMPADVGSAIAPDTATAFSATGTTSSASSPEEDLGRLLGEQLTTSHMTARHQDGPADSRKADSLRPVVSPGFTITAQSGTGQHATTNRIIRQTRKAVPADSAVSVTPSTRRRPRGRRALTGLIAGTMIAITGITLALILGTAQPKALITLSGKGTTNSRPFLVKTPTLAVHYSWDSCSAHGRFAAYLQNGYADSILIASADGASGARTTTVHPYYPGQYYNLTVDSNCSWSVVIRK